MGVPLIGSHGSVESVALSRTGMLASSGGDGVVRFWGAVSAPPYKQLQQQICGFLGGGMSRAEWRHIVPSITYQATCPAKPSATTS